MDVNSRLQTGVNWLQILPRELRDYIDEYALTEEGGLLADFLDEMPEHAIANDLTQSYASRGPNAWRQFERLKPGVKSTTADMSRTALGD